MAEGGSRGSGGCPFARGCCGVDCFGVDCFGVGRFGVGCFGFGSGRFGIGFNSVYHLCEVPCFLSGKHVVWFDPQARFLPGVNPANPGKMVDFLGGG